jgi:decaprenyl-phosphate phosphoribosyltransferase
MLGRRIYKLSLIHVDEMGSKVSRSMFLALRPKQWVKNLLVAAAPVAAGQIQEEMLQVCIGILGFIFASSFGYLINDWLDRDRDRLHATKKLRPFASGKLGIAHLLSLTLGCIIGAMACAYVLPSIYSIALATYLLITLSYSIFVKHQPVLEMLWLSSSFLIRAIAGSTIISESPTGWFVICVFFGALFVVSAKRLAEFKSPEGVTTRGVMKLYSEEFLQTIFTTSLTVTSLTYALWAFDFRENTFLAQISIIPFVTSLYLYAYNCEQGDAQKPEELLFKSRSFLVAAFVTLLCLLLVFYK